MRGGGMKKWIVDVGIAIALVGVICGVAIFSQGPGIRFVYFAF